MGGGPTYGIDKAKVKTMVYIQVRSGGYDRRTTKHVEYKERSIKNGPWVDDAQRDQEQCGFLYILNL